MDFDWVIGLGAVFLILLIFIVSIGLLIVEVLLGIYLANYLHFTGFLWWMCVLLVFLIINGLICRITIKGEI